MLRLLADYGCAEPETVLDLACGSGSLSVELAQRGVDVIGVDGSADMLAKANEKAAAAGKPLLFLQQDMRELDLYGTVDAAVCMLDSLSHLCRTADLREVFRRLHLFVAPGGLLILTSTRRTSTARCSATTPLCLKRMILCASGAIVWRNAAALWICSWISLWTAAVATGG